MRIFTAALAPVLCLGPLAAPLGAQTVTDAAEPPISAVAALVKSRTMFDEGLATRDPYLMFAAAAVRRSVPLDPVPADTGVTAYVAPQVIGWSAMLDEAEMLIGTSDGALLAEIADFRSMNMRGVSTGAMFRNATIAPGAATEFDAIAFDGPAAAEVYVEGVEAADLNLFVYDEAKALICADEDTSYIAHCFWETEAPGAYVIKVVNGGAIASSYALITN